MRIKTKAIKNPYCLVDTYKDSKYAAYDSPAAKESRQTHAGYGWCLKCGFSNRCKSDCDTIRLSFNSGFSPCCLDCWEESDLKERLEIGKALFRSWLVGYMGAAFSKYIIFPEDHPEWVHIKNIIAENYGK